MGWLPSLLDESCEMLGSGRRIASWQSRVRCAGRNLICYQMNDDSKLRVSLFERQPSLRQLSDKSGRSRLGNCQVSERKWPIVLGRLHLVSVNPSRAAYLEVVHLTGLRICDPNPLQTTISETTQDQ